jgi:hypothetical protein
MFYRLYILLDKGVYLFSNTKRPVPDSLRKTAPEITIDKVINTDSVNVPVMAITKNKPVSFVPSRFVYTYKDGYVRINLPENDKKYNIKFFEDNETFLFELKDIKERIFRIDKTNFYHAGWFRFELYEDGKLIEKHKFFLEKDF